MTTETLDPPPCPTCAAPAAWADPCGVWWLCRKCAPEGKRFAIDEREAAKYERWYFARFGELHESIRRRVPTPRG